MAREIREWTIHHYIGICFLRPNGNVVLVVDR
jgi:hypothetical protein